MKRLIVSIVLVGCGGDDGGGGGSVALEDLGMELAVASCGVQFECCTDAEIMAQYMGIEFDGAPVETEQQCVAFSNAVFASFAVAQYQDSIAMGRMEYDGAAAADCIAAIASLSCAAYSTGDISVTGSNCRPFVIAKVADGGGCTQDHECTSDNCEGASTPLGGPNTDGVCKPIPTAGQSCEENCTSGLYCGSDLSSSMDTCRPVKADGAQCNFDDECTSDNCEMRMCSTKLPTCDGR
jgi:hypothetical protein